jgi:pimeloyl-ACP methyl ester carboxylesterase
MPVVTRDGVDLYYSIVGSGPGIVFHTGGGGDGSMWATAGYTDVLPDYRHIMFDHRGHGRSAKPGSVEQHRLREYVDDVRAVLEAEHVAPVVFIGYSAGGVVGCALAAKFPRLVSALVVIGGVAHPDDDQGTWRRQAAHDVRATGVATAISEMATAEYEPPPAWFVDNLVATSDEMFALPLEAWADDPNESTLFPAIRCPTLIVCGDAENDDGSADLAQGALADGEVVIIPRCGHLQVFWASDRTGPAIARFLERKAQIIAG